MKLYGSKSEEESTRNLDKIDNQAKSLADYFGGEILNSEPKENN